MIEIYMMAWNRLLECREMLLPEWERKIQGDDLLAKFRAMDFMEITKEALPIKELVMTVFLDGTEIE